MSTYDNKPPNNKGKILFVTWCVATIIVFCMAVEKAHAFDWQEVYIKVGAGYKFDETSIRYDDDNTNTPISARFEIGKCDSVTVGEVCYGVSHHSQWATGWPVNDGMEYQKSEVFIDYSVTLGDLF